jgi:hypothetical protein
LVSFVFRLAKRREMPTGWMLAAQAGFSHLTNRPGDEAITRLAVLANVEVDELRAISYGDWDPVRAVFRGLDVPATLLKAHVARRVVCPACLAESAHHRAVWDLSFASACPVHRREMVDACPECGRALRWAGNDLTRCKCSADLTKAVSASVAPEMLDGVAAAYGLLSCKARCAGDEQFAAAAADARSLAPLRDLGPVHAFEFLYRVGMDLTPGVRRKLFSLEQPGKLDELAYAALHRGLEVARGWPASFAEVPATVAQIWGLGRDETAKKWVRAVERWLGGLGPGQGGAVREGCGIVVGATENWAGRRGLTA